MRIIAAAMLALAAGIPLLGQSSQQTRPNIILISVDTLRADRLRCNAPSAEPTPNIDKFLEGGTTFSQETSMVPLTLPSHVAMLTSTYPLVNGVDDNAERLAPGAITLAGTLRAHGYQTAAIVGSFVLDRRFGPDQGFETYDSPPASLRTSSSDPGDIKRKGEDVAKAGEAWLDKHASRPFFLFLHLYDLHTPYNLTADEEATYGKGYDGEVRYIDHVIGNLQNYLNAHGLFDHSLIVLTSDHGEGLGDHGETTHGFFLYQSTLHVPLIIHWPAGTARLPARVETPVSLLDLSPTILDFVNLRPPQTMQGASMLAGGSAAREIWSQSVYPERHFGARALTALRRGHYKYIEAPKPEFYDLSQDPGELHNLYAGKASVASAYRERLQQISTSNKPRAPLQTNPLSPEAIERLHALGYLTGTHSVPNTKPSAVDPKDRIADYEAYGDAITLASQGRLEEADAALRAILKKAPELSDVRLTLGLNEQRMGKDAEALEQFRAVLAAEPASAIAHLDAGLSEFHLQQYNQAEKELGAALAISPGYLKAEIWRAKALAQEGQLDQAATAFHHVLEETPDSYEAHDGLGTVAAMRGDWAESEKQLQLALRLEPAAADTHNTLGSVYLRQGQADAARGQFEEAIRLKPNDAAAHYNLGIALVALKDIEGARAAFARALEADSNYTPARNALARLSQAP